MTDDSERTFKNQIKEHLADIVIFVIIGITFIPQIPATIKIIVMLVGFVGFFPLLTAFEKVSQWDASAYWAMKATIQPINKEITFYIDRSLGLKPSTPVKDKEGWFVTGPFKLAKKVNLPILSEIEAFEIEHEDEWENRMMGDPGRVEYMSQSIQHNNVYRVELWIEPKRYTRLDRLEPKPRFLLRSAPLDYWRFYGIPTSKLLLDDNEKANKQLICGSCRAILPKNIENGKVTCLKCKTINKVKNFV